MVTMIELFKIVGLVVALMGMGFGLGYLICLSHILRDRNKDGE